MGLVLHVPWLYRLSPCYLNLGAPFKSSVPRSSHIWPSDPSTASFCSAALASRVTGRDSTNLAVLP